jgi:hypothetical protein
MGINSSSCGGLMKPTCGCDECEVTSAMGFGKCDLNKDPAFLNEFVYTGFEPIYEKQQIQIADASAPLKVMVKSVQGVKYFMWKESSAPVNSPWAKSLGAEIDGFYSPTIYLAQDPAFPRWKIYFYVVKYPSDELVPDCTKYYSFAGNLAVSPTELTKIDDEIIKKIVNHEKNNIEANLDINVGYNRKAKLEEIKKRMSMPCINLGKVIPEENSCNCIKTQKYECKIYGTCRKMGANIDGVKVCSDCKEYSPIDEF